MDINLAKEILQCLPEGRTQFFYFKDRYALLLLRLACREGLSVRGLRQSSLARLLDKGAVKEVIRSSGSGIISEEDLVNYWPSRVHCYPISFGLWGSEKKRRHLQTSRTGYNLVLQMNFSNVHDLCYRNLKIDEDDDWFDYGFHPTSKTRHTMAWSRIDLDLESDTALVEEIQTDWLRFAKEAYDKAKKIQPDESKRNSVSGWYYDFTPSQVIEYFEKVVREHLAIWGEAMLSATLEFLLYEIGVKKIYYHSWDTGRRVKRCSPPKSVYSDLPEKFCFQVVDEGPEFLLQSKSSRRKMKKIDQQSWYLLELPGVSSTSLGLGRGQLLTA